METMTVSISCWYRQLTAKRIANTAPYTAKSAPCTANT